jgi:DNA-binding response OmpR family regulator
MHESKTILLVDDSTDDLFLMRIAFQKAEFNSFLQEIHDGEQAISYLKGDGQYKDRRKFPLPALILLDLNMPMKNGFDVLTWARAQTGLKHLTIIVLTASTRPQDVQRAFDLGATSFLVKPTELGELVAMIRCLRDWIQINHYPPLNDRARPG